MRLAVHGGFLQVDTSPGAAEGLAEGDGPLPGLSTRVTVLAGVAELAEEIDVRRAEQAREAATQRVDELRAGPRRRPTRGRRRGRRSWREAEGALARAELRLAVAAGERRLARPAAGPVPPAGPGSAERDRAELGQLAPGRGWRRSCAAFPTWSA